MQDGAGISTGYTMFFSRFRRFSPSWSGVGFKPTYFFRLSAVLYRLMYVSTICHENFWELGLWDMIMTERDGILGKYTPGWPTSSICLRIWELVSRACLRADDDYGWIFRWCRAQEDNNHFAARGGDNCSSTCLSAPSVMGSFLTTYHHHGTSDRDLPASQDCWIRDCYGRKEMGTEYLGKGDGRL